MSGYKRKKDIRPVLIRSIESCEQSQEVKQFSEIEIKLSLEKNTFLNRKAEERRLEWERDFWKQKCYELLRKDL